MWTSRDAALLLDASLCDAAPGDVRAIASSALLFGGRGVFFAKCSTPAANDALLEDAIRSTNAYLAHIGNQMLAMTPRAVYTSSPFPIKETTPLNSTGAWIIEMSGGVVATIMDKDGNESPPMVLVANLQSDASNDAAREISVQFASRVAGYSPIVGDGTAGFSKCSKLVLGATMNVKLLPGQVVLVALTVVSPTE